MASSSEQRSAGDHRHPPRTPVALALVALAFPAGDVSAAEGSLTYRDVRPLEADGVPIDLGSHAVPRLVDVDADSDMDLLVGGGDGYVWLFLNESSPGGEGMVPFGPGAKLQADGMPIRCGTSYTTACFADMTGDGLGDLVVGYDRRVRLYANVGTAIAPAFGPSTELEGVAGLEFLPDGCGGRIDAADWDEDGRIDLWAGAFDGDLTLYLNVGTTSEPAFDAGEMYAHWPYNTLPTVFDLNGDGRKDLLYGINWGYVCVYVNVGEEGAPELGPEYQLRSMDGSPMNIREIIGDDTSPTFADLDGDGVLDLVSGGWYGKIWLLPGAPITDVLARCEEVVADHPADLGSALAADPDLRQELFGLHRGAFDYVTGFLRDDLARAPVRDWYATYIGDHPQYLLRQHLDTSVQPYVPYLAGQTWANLLASQSDSPAHRAFVATTTGTTGRIADVLLHHGVVLMENGSSTDAQQRVVDEYLGALPAGLWYVDFITMADFLGPQDGVNIYCNSAVNVLSDDVGAVHENSFPSDSPPGMTDRYSIVVAHEVNHTTLDRVGQQLFPELVVRKYELIAAAAGDDIVFRDPITDGWDVSATQALFLERGYWDGITSHWNAAWNAYWQSGPGLVRTEHWLRNNTQLMVEAPQEGFATLANQYFTDSGLMLELARSRWGRGILDCANQFVLMVDYYSQLGSDVTFFRIDTQGVIETQDVQLLRDARGHLSTLFWNGLRYDFVIDEAGDVIVFAEPVVGVPGTDSVSPALALRAGPNPFAGAVRLTVASPASPSTLRIYDPVGRCVRSFGIGTFGGAVSWDGRDTAGRALPAGMYFLQLASGAETRQLKLVKLGGERTP